jgi:hypothetical protein
MKMADDSTTRKVLLSNVGNIAHDLPSRDKYYRTSTANYTIEQVLLLLLVET